MIKSFCNRAFLPECPEDFQTIYLDYSDQRKKIILGGGNNVILSRDYYPNDFIVVGESFSEIYMERDNTIMCQSGVNSKIFS